MNSEINAHAAALGVATDATANATPAAADSPCCGDSSACARAGTDPVAAAAARRVEIEAARDELEAAAVAYFGMLAGTDPPTYEQWSSAFDGFRNAAAAAVSLRKGTT